MQLLHLTPKFIFWNCRKTRSYFESRPKTVNIHGYSELREPIITRENCYPLIWWILILFIVNPSSPESTEWPKSIFFWQYRYIIKRKGFENRLRAASLFLQIWRRVHARASVERRSREARGTSGGRVLHYYPSHSAQIANENTTTYMECDSCWVPNGHNGPARALLTRYLSNTVQQYKCSWSNIKNYRNNIIST